MNPRWGRRHNTEAASPASFNQRYRLAFNYALREHLIASPRGTQIPDVCTAFRGALKGKVFEHSGNP